MRWMPLTVGIALGAVVLFAAAAGRREAPVGRPGTVETVVRPNAGKMQVDGGRAETAPRSVETPASPAAAAQAPADPKERAREGQRKLARKMAAALMLEDVARERFTADYLEFIEGALQVDYRTQSEETVAAVIRARQSEFEARASVYLASAQMDELREMLRTW